jgi:outer membrane protein assembly factor BamB
VYIAYGALAGDCSDYHGYVVAQHTSLARGLETYSALQYDPNAVGGGIWATSGPSIDSAGNVWVAVGNGTTNGSYDYSDSILKLSPSLALLDYFAPSTWLQDNQNDADLGSTGPALVPGNYVYADGKSGTGYLLNQANLGHIGGELHSATVCDSFGGTALLGTRLFVPCTDGTRAIDIQTGTFQVAWQAADGSTNSPPVVGGGAVWVLGVGSRVLYALDPNSGATITALFVGPLQHFVTPTLSGPDVFVPISQGILAVSGA